VKLTNDALHRHIRLDARRGRIYFYVTPFSEGEGTRPIPAG